MKVFIGWSGSRSQAMAQALRDWLPLVLHYVQPWLSDKDIEAGERWADSMSKELEASNFGIICVTPENLSSPWILFEAGSLAKSLSNSRVIPLLLDLDFSEVSGPLAQFQAKKVDQEGISEAILSINGAAQQPIPAERAKQLFDALWPDLAKKLQAIPSPKEPTKPARNQHQILEELVAGVRSLESRIRELAELSANQRLPRNRRMNRLMHPMMLMDALGAKPGDPLLLLAYSSFFRDEIPWLYELAVDAYKATKSCAPDAKESLERFHHAIRFLRRGPFLEEFGGDPHMLEMMLHDMDHLIARQPALPESPEETLPKTRRKRPPKDEQ